MSVVLTGEAPFRSVLGYEKMLDEHGREMHGSWGNMIEAEDAFARMGADVMRWQYCAQPPTQNLLFGFGPADEIKRKLLTLWNSVKFFVDYANIEGFQPEYDTLAEGPRGELTALDRWLVARTEQLVADAEEAYESFLTVRVLRAFDAYLDDLSNWYIRRSRRRFWDGDPVALGTLWFALAESLRVLAPIMPFLTEHLWRNLVAGGAVGEAVPESVHLAPWPAAGERDEALLAEIAEVRRVVELARQARSSSGLKLRQPLRRLVVEGAPGAASHADEIAEELRVKSVEFGEVEAQELVVKPHLPALGPRLGKELAAVRAALAAGDLEDLGGGRFRVLGHELGPEEVLVERRGKEGWAVAAEEGVTVALDTSLDDELRREARVLDLVHQLNTMRKDAGLELTDRIVVTLSSTDADLLDEHADWIKQETLAVELKTNGDVAQPQIARA
jgi:isoleucyl-tRNA synthetase